ncbi:PREDICTED: uncharacterized protein LOC109580633 [Amphimedon queenslandica]|uniref:Uncharacterized protein n=2 Tax=Amphimedon queenslandica TaxID=400682 RepID=A0AAN0IYH0_AMPQE|nr:PREDICTED: uncharacterized protein LOC109580633 [Amphimedon queenslandica]|eukprot:XP_019849597.1 PREDICTED: uncharacterized protein LOC109580633 [Amphimedon queenslandica]
MYSSNGMFTVHNCSFTFNSVVVKTASMFSNSEFPSGGLAVFLSGFAHNNTINIENSVFTNNSGLYGGGLYIFCRESSTNNGIRVNNVTIFNNNALLGGGGLEVGFVFRKPAVNKLNNVIVQSCNISSNRAYFGGGFVFFVTAAHQNDPSNTLDNNYITFNTSGNSSSGAGISSVGAGALNSKAISFTLSGLITFSENNGTAVYLIDSNFIALQGTSVIFSNNSGTYGGAVSINGFASIYASSNTSFVFLNNKTSVKGGAIFFFSTAIISSILIVASCFVEHTDSSETISFYFKNNTDSFGKSVYVSSLLPCNKLCQGLKVYLDYMPPEKLLTQKCVGNFTFSDHNGTVQGNVATESSEFDQLHKDSKAVKKLYLVKMF